MRLSHVTHILVISRVQGSKGPTRSLACFTSIIIFGRTSFHTFAHTRPSATLHPFLPAIPSPCFSHCAASASVSTLHLTLIHDALISFHATPVYGYPIHGGNKPSLILPTTAPAHLDDMSLGTEASTTCNTSNLNELQTPGNRHPPLPRS